MRMKKRTILLVSFFVLVFAMTTGCASKEYKPETVSGYDADENTMILNQDGTITEFIADKFDTSSYSVDALRTSIESEITAYNQSNPDAISLSLCELNGGKVYIEILYKTAEDYSAFNGVNMFYGNIADAINSGYNFDAVTYKNFEGEAFTLDSITTDENTKVFVIFKDYNIRAMQGVKYHEAQDTAFNEYEISPAKGDGIHSVIL